MKRLLLNTALSLAPALGLGAHAVAKVQENSNKPSSAHAAAVKRCRDNYRAAENAARKITEQAARDAALAAANRDCADCIKRASRIH